MATQLWESYEQQYSSLTAEIVNKTGRIPNLSGTEKQSLITNVEKLFEETKELLEQMELEVRELPTASRNKHQTRLKSFQAELTKLEKALRKSRIAFCDEVHVRDELLGSEETNRSQDQRQRLLENTERLERTSKNLDAGYKTCIETEEIGSAILEDLHDQRQTLQRSRDRLRDTNEALGKSSRVLSGMMKRVIQNRILLVALSVTMVVVIGIAIYFATKRHS
ncbi:hypothetical protein CAPTEDRAFT_152399 [Capitella teleta]|uniref:Vesicle transport through interaction with t-SNAREs homolog 1A n=1 Tax=Capitella teleta TaxID=283909 RepID=R7V1F2_CAPTE|nr:hypothetical protein CAPTEDRAFT_152399 [Capitella teleta]|eukprot:ELU10032.1 hypothetical protein CAPTEDRAFT_152399 [Capitella teleta]